MSEASKDFGAHRTKLTRILFSAVQRLDGVEDTQPNGDGVLPEILRDCRFPSVEETIETPTLVGSNSLYRAINHSRA